MNKEQSPDTLLTSSKPGIDQATTYLVQEFNIWKARFGDQPTLTQRFLETQGRKVADLLLEHAVQTHFTFPDKVVIRTASPSEEKSETVFVPPGLREQGVGGLMERFRKIGLGVLLRQRLDELESHTDPAVAISAGLIRFAIANQLVHNMLPAGRTVIYTSESDEEIPTIPVADVLEPSSAITATTDAIVEAEQRITEEGRGELVVPYTPAARRFYLPQWVAFDDQDQLQVNTIGEAEAYISSMQRFVNTLHAAVSLASYMIADPEYQQKRYGILGQLVNQGRALARYQTQEIIETIRRRASTQSLNRGLSLDLPYFDDQDLQMKIHSCDVIPSGRIMFVPAFVVLASRKEQVKVAQDTRLSPSTRKHLLEELHTLEQAFEELDLSQKAQ